MSSPPPRTAIVGAGPAGLLFALVGKILMGDAWHVELYDKRERYVRTHRLRIAREPWLELGEALRDPRFDALVAFLEAHRFAPEVNVLEAKLTSLVAELGVRKVVRDITAIEALDVETVVAADSVHSTIRERVRGDTPRDRFTHERLARLRVVGDDLPERLGVVDQFRLSKVLGSVVDWRRNDNGFAELDLFLGEDEHALAESLGASPSAPVPIDSATLRPLRAPLFRAIVAHLERPGRTILLQSTFRLEHAIVARRTFQHAGKTVFLVGDAGVSLPFMRGMACLASCVHALARAHHERTFDRYDRDVDAIVRHELAIVRARAQLVRGLRELVRLSALLPFPIQSWWLSAARAPVADRLSPGARFNAAIALSALGLAVAAVVTPVVALASLPVQVAGGVAYRWTLDLEPGPHRWLRRIWELQIAVVLLGGGLLALARRLPWIAAAWWWILGAAFVVGVYAFEWGVARRLRGAALDE